MSLPLSRRALSAAAVPAALAGLLAAAPSASAANFRSTATLTGAAETQSADRDASGTATITVNPFRNQVCFDITVTGIPKALAAHIHEAPAGVAGSVVVPLAAPDASGHSQGCTNSDPTLHAVLRGIANHPENYYVNVHTKAFPAGAVRGQLAAAG